MIINVLPWREGKHARIKRTFLKQCAVSILIGFFIVFCVHLLWTHRLHTQKKKNTVLNAQINMYNQAIQSAASATILSKTIMQQKIIIANLKNEQTQTMTLFNLFQTMLPKDVYLTQINRAGNIITLMGNASRNQAVSELMQYLEKLPDFNSVHLKKISAKKFEIDLVEFS